MPYKCATKRIPEKFDKRVVLTKSQKEEIYMIYNYYGSYSLRELATMYGVSKRTIQFITDPAKQEANLERLKERGGSKIYYNKDTHRTQMRKHRRYKQKLYLDGKLEE